MSRLETRVPPLVVVLVVAALMWLTASLTPSVDVPLAWRVGAAFAFAGLTAAVAVVTVTAFRTAGTTVNPTTPDRTSSLVTAGIYRRSRNPMYLGMLFGLLAVAMLLANVFALLLVVAFVAYMDRFQIGPEERALRELFGEDYERYAQRVRRWI